MKIHIHHRTSYHYSVKVSLGAHRLMMRPREGQGARLESFSLGISVPHRLRWIRDLHENNVGLVDFTELASGLVIESNSTLDITERSPFDFILLPDAAEYPFSYDHELLIELLPLSQSIYVRDVDRIRDWLVPFWHPGKKVETLGLLQQLNLHIYRTFRYQRREQRGVLSPAETLENNGGSCRDFATLYMEICRFMGLAARFVSGYMYSAEIEGRMSMHGWAEVYLPGAGWIGFDPSWGLLAAWNYFPVAFSRHSEHVPPISGTYFGTQGAFLGTEVDLYVRREDPPLASLNLAPGRTLSQDQSQLTSASEKPFLVSSLQSQDNLRFSNPEPLFSQRQDQKLLGSEMKQTNLSELLDLE